MNRGRVTGAVRMMQTPTHTTKYQLSAVIDFDTDGQVQRQTRMGHGNDLKSAWLDMFKQFNNDFGNVFITNGKLTGHDIIWD
tara:strand:+ start:342 stop:587 length:246 start_codon:yes stop_codon:yes gene_type:complete